MGGNKLETHTVVDTLCYAFMLLVMYLQDAKIYKCCLWLVPGRFAFYVKIQDSKFMVTFLFNQENSTEGERQTLPSIYQELLPITQQHLGSDIDPDMSNQQ